MKQTTFASLAWLDELLHGAEAKLYADQAYWSEDHRGSASCRQKPTVDPLDRTPNTQARVIEIPIRLRK